MPLLYNITNSTEFINIDGIVGTSKAGISYSLKKDNIVKFDKIASINSLAVVMLDQKVYNFTYTECKDPATGVAFVSLDVFETVMEGFAGSDATSYPTNFFSTKTTLGLVALQILPTSGAGWITIKAHPDNADNITVGNSTVVAGSSFELQPGEAVSMEHSNLSQIYLISATTGMIFYIIGSTK